jgi:predicted GIY-YIG superfamily endonuclease
MKHYAYIVECADSTYYCGYTNDLERDRDGLFSCLAV